METDEAVRRYRGYRSWETVIPSIGETILSRFLFIDPASILGPEELFLCTEGYSHLRHSERSKE